MKAAAEAYKDLVLVGGGHAHVQVIRRWMMRPVPGVRLTLVVDRPDAVYSGMVPGFVAGDYRSHELEIDVVPLARRARARVILAAATRVDPNARRIALEGRPALSYDAASLDVGSTVRGLSIDGVAEHALATRPIRSFVDALDERVAQIAARRNGGPLRLAVVGAGAAGIELAFTLEARLRASGLPVCVSLLTDAPALLPRTPALARRVRQEAARRGITLKLDVPVAGVEKGCVRLDGAEEAWPCDLAVWATGAAALPVVLGSPLPLDPAGFIRTGPDLSVEGHPELFAVGDCARQVQHPWVPRAGVYAVRQGPVLDHNLRARLAGGRLRAYRPQRDFLALLNLGERRALGSKWGRVFAGPLVWQLKDAIDRRFMRRFQVLGTDGEPTPDFPSALSMGMEEMPCGGCAAKVGPDPLAHALARLAPAAPDERVELGLDHPDDVAAYRTGGGDLVLATVDGFRAFSDDPWLVGRVAAVNALSDVFAKGGLPRHALALVTVPELRSGAAEEALHQVLAGVRAALDPLGVSLLGGHSTAGPELFVGLCVTGELPAGAQPLRLDGLRTGDALLLSKSLGTGVLLAADMQGLATGSWVRACHASMLRPNDAAARVARECAATACTDVSGFGLAGHLGEMLRASGYAARLDTDALPLLPGTASLLRRGVRSTFHDQNRAPLANAAALESAPVLFDPQTSGGLLFGVAEERAAAALSALRAAGEQAARIGRVTLGPAGQISLSTPPS